MKKIRISCIASTLDVGGSENVMYDVITRLAADRFESQLLLLKAPGKVGERLLEHVDGAHSLQAGRNDPAVLPRLVSRLRSFAPDIVFSLDHRNAIFWGGLASLIAGVPRRVVASHSTGRMNGRMSFGALERMMLGETDCVIALSDSHAAYLREVEGITGRIDIVQNGIDVARYESTDEPGAAAIRSELGLEADDKVIIMVASLRPEKAHEALLGASRTLSGARDDVKALIVGDGPRRAALERMRDDLGLAKEVRFLGERSDVAALLAVSTVLVLPSHPAVETLPLAVLEAMAAGVPVIASRVGSLPDLIRDGENGLLIEPADADGLVSAICSIINNQTRTAAIVDSARRTVRGTYTVERMVGSYESLFTALAS